MYYTTMRYEGEPTDQVLAVLRLRMEILSLGLEGLRLRPEPETMADVRAIGERLFEIVEIADMALDEWRTLDARMTTGEPAPLQWRMLAP